MKQFLDDYLSHLTDHHNILPIRHNPSEKSFCQIALLLRMHFGKCKIGFVSFLIGEK